MNNENGENSYRHILKYTGLFGGIQLMTILTGLVKTKLVAIILGPAGMGLISLFNSTLTFMSSLTGLGLSTSAVKSLSEAFESGDASRLEREISTVRSWGVLAAVLGTALTAMLSGLLDRITFTWGDHTLHFIALSPIVGLTAITGCELAVLKSTRRLRRLACISIYGVLASVLAATPIYYIWGMSGVVPGLLSAALLQAVITVFYSWRCHPPHLSFSRIQFTNGVPMVRLGIAFITAGVLTSGAEFAIRSFLNNTAELDTVGLYSAGYMIVVTYGGMFFSAMETDYYPRLSAMTGRAGFNAVVNRQCEVSLLLAAPMLTVFIILVPLILPLLFSARFATVTGMVQAALLALYVRAVKLPVAYVSLAQGDSVLFLSIEALYAVLITVAVTTGFTLCGLTGAGVAITAIGLVEYVILLFAVCRKYNYRPSRSLRRIMFLHFPLGAAAYCLTVTADGITYWLSGAALALASCAVSAHYFRHKTKLTDTASPKHFATD